MKRRFLSLVLLCFLLLPAFLACRQDPLQEQPTDTAPITQTDAQSTPDDQTDAPIQTETQEVLETETQTDDGRTVVEIVCPIADAVTFTGGELIQDVTDTAFVPVSFTLKYGYTYEGYEIDGKLYEGTEIALKNVTKDTTVTLKLDYLTRELPVVHLSTDGAPISSKEEYVDMTFSLANTAEELYGITGGVRLRGNSTAGYEKKPYRIKFDQKVSLFG